MTKLDQALALAARGFSVFPIKAGAKAPPLIDNFPARATFGSEQIHTWWGAWPEANIGISTSRFGKDKALLVVDVDNKGDKNGNAALFDLALEGFETPPTFTQLTPTGGRHLVYVVDHACKQGVNALGDGLDTRSRGGYILGAGSEVKAGLYSVRDDRDVQMAPQWLVDRCGVARVRRDQLADQPVLRVDADNAVARAVHYLDHEAPLALEGHGGDETTFKVACRLKDLGVPEAQALGLMTDWNERCSPPWRHIDLEFKIRNAYAYGTVAPGAAAPEAVFTKVEQAQEMNAYTERVQPEIVDSKLHPILELNRDHAFVIAGGGAHVLWETTDAAGNYALEHLQMSAFHQKHAAVKLQAGKRSEPVTQLWIEDSRRRSYDGLCFRPEQPSPPRFYNLWRGFAHKPAEPGEQFPQEQHDAVSAFLEHARSNVCADDAGLYRWLIGYFAHLVQRPWEKPLVALVFRGGKGVGKNALVERVGALLGGHFLLTSNRRYLVGNFNGHLENCLLFALDEAFWSGDKQAEGQLKDLITGGHHVIERKGQETFKVENRTRIVIIGNEDWLVPASHDERRFAVFGVGDGRKQDTKFFERMRFAMEAGGYRLLLRYLLDFDLAGIDVNVAPATAGLLDQKHSSLEPVKQWWFDCLSQGRITGGAFDNNWPEFVDCDAMREAFKRSAADRRISARLPDQTMLGKVFKDVCPGMPRTKKRSGPNTSWVYKVPPLAECRAAWDKFIGQPVEWPE
jgi:hypothetical protein